MTERQFSSGYPENDIVEIAENDLFFTIEQSSSSEAEVSAAAEENLIEEDSITENGDEDSEPENSTDFHISRRVLLVLALSIVVLSGTLILWSKILSRKV